MIRAYIRSAIWRHYMRASSKEVQEYAVRILAHSKTPLPKDWWRSQKYWARNTEV